MSLKGNGGVPAPASGRQDSTSAEAQVSILINSAGTIDRLRAQLMGAGTAGGNCTFTVQKNGTNQTLAATIASGGTTASDNANSFAVVAGDRVSITPTDPDPGTRSITWGPIPAGDSVYVPLQRFGTVDATLPLVKS